MKEEIIEEKTFRKIHYSLIQTDNEYCVLKFNSIGIMENLGGYQTLEEAKEFFDFLPKIK